MCLTCHGRADLQNKLELVTGIPAANQQIVLLNNEDDAEPIASLSDDSRPLGFYSVRDLQVLKVRVLDICNAFILQC